jgi:predicted branched-subunit amino acid permease
MLLDERFELRLTKREREALDEQARRVGLNASQYLRWMIRTHDTSAVIKSGNVRSR